MSDDPRKLQHSDYAVSPTKKPILTFLTAVPLGSTVELQKVHHLVKLRDRRYVSKVLWTKHFASKLNEISISPAEIQKTTVGSEIEGIREINDTVSTEEHVLTSSMASQSVAQTTSTVGIKVIDSPVQFLETQSSSSAKIPNSEITYSDEFESSISSNAIIEKHLSDEIDIQADSYGSQLTPIIFDPAALSTIEEEKTIDVLGWSSPSSVSSHYSGTSGFLSTEVTTAGQQSAVTSQSIFHESQQSHPSPSRSVEDPNTIVREFIRQMMYPLPPTPIESIKRASSAVPIEFVKIDGKGNIVQTCGFLLSGTSGDEVD